MNFTEINANTLFLEIQADFNSLWSVKDRQGTIEFITPYSTLAGEFVSVFLTRRENGYVVSDGGRLYEIGLEQDVDLKTRSRIHYCDLMGKYEVKETIRSTDRRVFCYKVTQDIAMLSACIYDLARFQEMVSNAVLLESMFDEEDSSESHYFAYRVRSLLGEKVRNLSTDQQKYELFLDEQLKLWKFTTGIRKVGTSNIWLGMAIHRSSMQVFERGVYSAAIGFKHAVKQIPSAQRTMSAIVDVLPDDISPKNKVAFLQNEMLSWKDDFGVTSLDYAEVDQMKSMNLFFPAA